MTRDIITAEVCADDCITEWGRRVSQMPSRTPCETRRSNTALKKGKMNPAEEVFKRSRRGSPKLKKIKRHYSKLKSWLHEVLVRYSLSFQLCFWSSISWGKDVALFLLNAPPCFPASHWLCLMMWVGSEVHIIFVVSIFFFFTQVTTPFWNFPPNTGLGVDDVYLYNMYCLQDLWTDRHGKVCILL